MAAFRSGSCLSGLLRVLRSPAVALTPPQSPAAALTPRSPALANRVHLDQVWPLRLLLVAHLTAGGRQLVGERAPAQPTCGGTRVPPSEPEATPCVRCRSAPSQVGGKNDAQCFPSSTCRRVAWLVACSLACLVVLPAAAHGRCRASFRAVRLFVCLCGARHPLHSHFCVPAEAPGSAAACAQTRPRVSTHEHPRAPTRSITHPPRHGCARCAADVAC